ncbi:MAG: hypothetical protein IKW38_00165 [Kiritimatiellae bacterium]|nr:hypothetical protein [Kiritimatiellia bacterium]
MNAHHLLADLESRIAELQDLSNDAYDIAAGTLLPGITDLAPPATPQQEVFGGGVEGGVVDDITNVTELSPPASWAVREIEEEVEQPVLDGEGNPVLNEDGTPKTETVKRKSWKVWSPIWQSGQTAYMPEGMAEGWNELPATEGEVYALLRDKTTDGNNTQWANAPILSIVSAQPNDKAIPYEPVTFSRWVKIGEFKDGHFDQAHIGVIVEDFEATAAGSATGVHTNNPATDKSLSEIAKCSWTVRYCSIYGGMNNVLTTGWMVYAPLWQVGRRLVKYARALSESQWIPLNFDSGELYAILKVTGEYTANNGYNFDNPGYELSWINEDPSTLPDYQDSDGVKFRWVKIGIFQQINGSAGFSQFHTGLIIDSTGSSSDVIGQPGKDGKDGVDGKDGATWEPSLRKETVTTPNPDNSGSTSHEEVYLDFTNSQTGEVIKGTVNLKGPKGDASDTSSGGASGNTVDLTYVKAITYADNVCSVTTATLKVLAVGEETTATTPLFTTTGHSTQHKSPNTSY